MKLEFNSIFELTSFIKTFKMGDETIDKIAEELMTFRPEFETKAPEIIPENKTPAEEIEITKEMLRERVTAIMAAGKGEQIRALITQHGATSIPTIKVEDYAIIYAEAKGLL